MLNGNRYFHPSAKRSNPLDLAHDPPISLPESPYPAPSFTFPLSYSFSQFFTLITFFYRLFALYFICTARISYYRLYKYPVTLRLIFVYLSLSLPLLLPWLMMIIKNCNRKLPTHNYYRFSFVFIIVVNNLN